MQLSSSAYVAPGVQRKIIEPMIVIRDVTAHFNLSESALTGTGRWRDVSLPRQLAMWLIKDGTKMTLKQIAQFFNRRDHSTVIHGVGNIAGFLSLPNDIPEKVQILDFLSKYGYSTQQAI